MGQAGSSEDGEKQTDSGYILEVGSTRLADGLNIGREEMRGIKNYALILKVWGLVILVHGRVHSLIWRKNGGEKEFKWKS